MMCYRVLLARNPLEACVLCMSCVSVSVVPGSVF